MKKCDIIVPIYNAYEFVDKCILSIIKNTEFNGNKLILINDKSPDANISKLINAYKQKYDFIDVLENDTNLGFVGTVNKGMQYSKNDVVLLNSDTEVTPNWLNNIIKCAYSEKMIGTVTPLSNNATLVSVPKGLKENNLPSNMSLEEYQELINKIAYNDICELPTAHGFCMFIKRELLNKIGYFDYESFGKGYGEENEFSFRCMDYGYKNVLCDNTIVFHKEKQSFSEKREKLVKEHSKILEDRYPLYTKRVELWCQEFPIKYICENIDYQLNMYKRQNILILIHDWSNVNNNVGGTTLHVLDLINSMRDKYNFHVFYPENGIYKVTSYFENSEKTIKFNSIDNYNLFGYYNHQYRKIIEQVVSAFRIDIIHVHHMIGHFFDILDVAKENKIKINITLHDFYCLCPSINMLYKMEKYCPFLKQKDCLKCLQYKTSLKNNVIPEWRKNWNKYLSEFDNIFVPSNNTKAEINKVYKNLEVKVIEHGIILEKSDYTPQIDNNVFNVAFVGVMSIHKGGKILSELVNKYQDKNIKFHLFGKTEFKGLEKNRKNYVFHGKYKREELPNLLKENNINLICSLSVWAETYSYTLTEEIASGVPVLSFDIGAVGDRIKENGYGWVIDYNSSSQEVYNKIKEIKNNVSDYEKKIKNIRKYKIKTVEQMASEYIPFYKNNNISKFNASSIENMKTIIKKDYSIKESIDTIEAHWILNSLKWRIVSKIKVPEFLKKIIKRLIRR